MFGMQMENGRFFLDLDGDAFEVVLQCLRTRRLFRGEDFGIAHMRVVNLARLLGLQEFMRTKLYIYSSNTGKYHLTTIYP